MDRLEIRGNALIVTCDLQPYIARDFEAKCKELLATGATELVLDLSGVREIGSVFVASLVETCVTAVDQGRSVTLRIRQKHRSFFDFADADPRIAIEVIE